MFQESAEWKARFESMKTQAEDSASLRSQYQVLQDQYKALSLVVLATEDSKTAAEVISLMYNNIVYCFTQLCFGNMVNMC